MVQSLSASLRAKSGTSWCKIYGSSGTRSQIAGAMAGAVAFVGGYLPHQRRESLLVAEANALDVTLLPPDVDASQPPCTLEVTADAAARRQAVMHHGMNYRPLH